MNDKVLIIKLGYSETLNPEISRTCSLGDVLRTTVLLNYLKDYNVSWLVDEKATPLLLGNKYINRILPWNLETAFQLKHEIFRWVINLEKTPGICALVEDITAWTHSGFRFDHVGGVAEAYNDAEKVLAIAHSNTDKKENTKYWQEHLAHMVRRKWNKEHCYIIPPRNQKKLYDIGFNTKVGTKWSNKGWALDNWHSLGRLVTKMGYKASWQEGFDDLDTYMDWVDSCKTIVTCDSLGLHLALAFKIPVLALFGPSSWKEVYLYERGEIVHSKAHNCAPCFQPECSIPDTNCMDALDVGIIAKKVDALCRTYMD